MGRNEEELRLENTGLGEPTADIATGRSAVPSGFIRNVGLAAYLPRVGCYEQLPADQRP